MLISSSNLTDAMKDLATLAILVILAILAMLAILAKMVKLAIIFRMCGANKFFKKAHSPFPGHCMWKVMMMMTND